MKYHTNIRRYTQRVFGPDLFPAVVLFLKFYISGTLYAHTKILLYLNTKIPLNIKVQANRQKPI